MIGIDPRHDVDVYVDHASRAGYRIVTAVDTPGHTPGSASYLLRNPEGAPWMVFTGDVHFAGDVGRIDLIGGERINETAGILYESVYRKILPLGDGLSFVPLTVPPYVSIVVVSR